MRLVTLSQVGLKLDGRGTVLLEGAITRDNVSYQQWLDDRLVSASSPLTGWIAYLMERAQCRIRSQRYVRVLSLFVC